MNTPTTRRIHKGLVVSLENAAELGMADYSIAELQVFIARCDQEIDDDTLREMNIAQLEMAILAKGGNLGAKF